jgi:hypothetical protein
MLIFFIFTGVLRLQGPLNANSAAGRVEIFYNGQWGTICDDSWGINDAKVACRKLGYSNGLKALQGSEVPDGSGQIWLDDVACTGNEQSLASCSHRGWGVHNCSHSQDAGVECVSAGNISFFSKISKNVV